MGKERWKILFDRLERIDARTHFERRDELLFLMADVKNSFFRRTDFKIICFKHVRHPDVVVFIPCEESRCLAAFACGMQSSLQAIAPLFIWSCLKTVFAEKAPSDERRAIMRGEILGFDGP